MLEIISVPRDASAPSTRQRFDSPPASLKLSEGHIHWLDFDRLGEAEARLLTETFQFHPVALEQCMEASQFPRADDYGDYLYLVFHAIDDNQPPGTVATVELDVFLGENFLITSREAPMTEVEALKEEVIKKPFTAARGSDFLLYLLLDRVVVDYFPRLSAFEERLDKFEDDALSDGGSTPIPGSMLQLKRELLGMKRVVYPQRELFLRLSRPDFSRLITPAAQYYLRDTYHEIYRVAEIIDTHREMLAALFETHYTLVSYRLNNVVRILTIVTTVLMPMSLLTGIYGMNFEHMPLLENRWGFPLTIAVMLIIAVGMLVLFRRRRWI